MTPIEKMQAVLNRLSRIPLQERKCLEIPAEVALAKCKSEAEVDFYYRKLVLQK